MVGLVVGDLVGFRMRGRGMEEEGKLGVGAGGCVCWGLPVVVRVRVVPAGFFYSESRSGC